MQTMRQVEKQNPDRFVASSTPGWGELGAALFCLAFLVYLQLPWEEMPEWRRHMLTCLAGLSAYIAIAWRRGARVARVGCGATNGGEGERFQLERWRGIPFQIWGNVVTVQPMAVLLERVVMPGPRWYFFHIISARAIDGRNYYVMHLSDITRAHALAGSLAEFLGVSMEDRTSEMEYRVSAFFLLFRHRQPSRWCARMTKTGGLEFYERAARSGYGRSI